MESRAVTARHHRKFRQRGEAIVGNDHRCRLQPEGKLDGVAASTL